MISLRNIILTIMTVLAFADLNAKTVSWAIYPNYEEITRYNNDIYVCKQNGKWGLVNSNNVEILPASYDYILPFTNGYAIAGSFSGSRYALECVISERGNVVMINDKLYLPLIYNTKNPHYFSEGKLAVIDSNGKYGYIGTDGLIVVKCQFNDALPFKEGWAPVRFSNNLVKYINDTYDRDPKRSIMAVDFQYGDMTLASCFTDGKAVVAYNDKLALIDNNGKKIKNLKESEFTQIYKINNSTSNDDNLFSNEKIYTEFSENGLNGLRHGNELVVKPQFGSFSSQFSDGYIIAEMNGLKGLLNVVDGNYAFDIKSKSDSALELEVDRKGIVEEIDLNISLHSSANNLKLFADCGNGTKQDITSAMSVNGKIAHVPITPLPIVDSESCIINVMLESDGIVVGEYSKEFALSYPIKLRISEPGAASIQADANDNAVFSSTVFNDSNKAVEVTATWSTGGKSETKIIPAYGKYEFRSSIKVYENHTRTVKISLDTGESSSRSIYFISYFNS